MATGNIQPSLTRKGRRVEKKEKNRGGGLKKEEKRRTSRDGRSFDLFRPVNYIKAKKKPKKKGKKRKGGKWESDSGNVLSPRAGEKGRGEKTEKKEKKGGGGDGTFTRRPPQSILSSSSLAPVIQKRRKKKKGYDLRKKGKGGGGEGGERGGISPSQAFLPSSVIITTELLQKEKRHAVFGRLAPTCEKWPTSMPREGGRRGEKEKGNDYGKRGKVQKKNFADRHLQFYHNQRRRHGERKGKKGGGNLEAKKKRREKNPPFRSLSTREI